MKSALAFIEGETPHYHVPVLTFILKTVKGNKDVKVGMYRFKNVQELKVIFDKNEHGLFGENEWAGVWKLGYGWYKPPIGKQGIGSGGKMERARGGIEKGKDQGRKKGKVMRRGKGGIEKRKDKGGKKGEVLKKGRKEVGGGNRFAVLADLDEE